MNTKYILAIFLILISLSIFSNATAYDINTDLDVNQFQADDYLDLTESAVGESLRSTAKNSDFIIAVLVIGAFASLLIIIIVAVLKRKG